MEVDEERKREKVRGAQGLYVTVFWFGERNIYYNVPVKYKIILKKKGRKTYMIIGRIRRLLGIQEGKRNKEEKTTQKETLCHSAFVFALLCLSIFFFFPLVLLSFSLLFSASKKKTKRGQSSCPLSVAHREKKRSSNGN